MPLLTWHDVRMRAWHPISIEMLFFALAHSYAFSAREYWVEAGQGAQPPRSVWSAAVSALDWSDVGQNMVGQVHFGAAELAGGVQSAGAAVLGGAAWPFVQLKRGLSRAKARSSDAAPPDDAPTAPASARRAGREALLPGGGTSSG
jgi:hypothetical protein